MKTGRRSEEPETMTDTFRPISEDRNSTPAPGPEGVPPEPSTSAGRALLVGLLGGIVSAAGYVVYTRLPAEQKDKLHQQVRQAAEGRLNELRSRFNI